MAVSGEQSPHPKQEAPTGSFEVPEGMVLVRESEHNQLHGDLRRTKAALKQRDEADADRQRREQQDAAAAAGQYDKAVGVERTAREQAEARARKATLGDSITDVLLSRNYTGEQAVAIKRLVDRDAVEFDGSGEPVRESVLAAVDSVVASFPNLFGPKDPEPEPPATPQRQRRPGPATPPAQQANDGKPADYLSPEEYASTPHKVRMTREFQDRATRSQDFWPQHIHRSDLQQDAS